MPGTSPIPDGQYRVVLQAKGSATVEQTLTVPARTVSAADAKYPTAVVEDGIIKVSGVTSGFEVWVYGKDGKFAGTFSPAGASKTLAVQGLAASSPGLSGGFSFRVFAWNAAAGYGVLSGSYPSGP
jgi:hypothetical protein